MSISQVTLFVSLHQWCRDVPRDEAVRASEDGRTGLLPTLEEAIAMIPKSGSASSGTEQENKGNDMAKSEAQAADYRAEMAAIAKAFREAARLLVTERDAAIREQESLREQLESVADRAAAAETALESAPAASGAAGTEPVAWGRNSKATGRITFVTTEPPVCVWSHEDIIPLYAAPQPARGWLTADEREAVKWFSRLDGQQYNGYCQHFAGVAKSLLARSAPPEVVLPMVGAWGVDGHAMLRRAEVIAAIAAAGVTVRRWGSRGQFGGG